MTEYPIDLHTLLLQRLNNRGHFTWRWRSNGWLECVGICDLFLLPEQEISVEWKEEPYSLTYKERRALHGCIELVYEWHCDLNEVKYRVRR
jgi:hypothetical protein